MRYEVDLSEASKFARTPAYGIPVIRAASRMRAGWRDPGRHEPLPDP